MKSMKNVLRTLVYNQQVSLTVADTTAIVREGIRRHGLSPVSAYVFGKALSVMTFMSACLKGETGEISFSLKGDGECGEIAVSGNRRLAMRGFIENTAIGGIANEETEFACLGKNAAVTIIRDDGYSRPFVGACALPENAGIDGGFEEYFRISEQLPTRIVSRVELDEKGDCIFAGVAVLQPLPFADNDTLNKVESFSLSALLDNVRQKGVAESVKSAFTEEFSVWEDRMAVYKCNCSRQYLTRVLVSLGKEQMLNIIRDDGSVHIHCHYCNTDYDFTEEDADRIFPQVD